MNKLNTAALGGMELHLEDFEWIQNAFKGNLKDILDAFGNFKIGVQTTNPTPIPGFDLTVGNTAGSVYFNGELFRVEPSTGFNVSSDSGYIIVVIDEFFDPSGDELNKAGSPIQTYIVRNAKLQGVEPGDTMPPNYLCDYADLLNFSTALLNIIPEPDFIDAGTFLTGFASDTAAPFKIRKGTDGIVRFKGRIRLTSSSPAFGMMTDTGFLPAGYFNANNRSFTVGSGSFLRIVQVTLDGRLFLTAQTGGNPLQQDELLTMDGISYHVD